MFNEASNKKVSGSKVSEAFLFVHIMAYHVLPCESKYSMSMRLLRYNVIFLYFE